MHMEAWKRRFQDILASACGCTGQCGTTHHKKPGAPCGKEPTHTRRQAAAPYDPSQPVQVRDGLIPWCPDCYAPAVRRGVQAREQRRASELEEAQESLF